jgi:ABC-type siderophore export system fused ATPase/permease subunit
MPFALGGTRESYGAGVVVGSGGYHEGVDDLFTLGSVDLAFSPGQISYLVGGNGSGKTSLAKLLVGLYRPEQGSVLLQGQRKRLALVVAYLEDRPFLVFDEWAADQDPVFKEVFYRELLPELKAMGKAVLVISHDDRYFHLADRAIRMENGQVVSVETAPAPGSKAMAVLSSGVVTPC